MGQKKLHIPNYLLTGRFGNKEKQNAREKRSLITMVIVLITTMMMKKSPLQTGRKRSPQSWSAKPRQTPWSRSSRGCSHCSAPRDSPPGCHTCLFVFLIKKSMLSCMFVCVLVSRSMVSCMCICFLDQYVDIVVHVFLCSWIGGWCCFSWYRDCFCQAYLFMFCVDSVMYVWLWSLWDCW